MDNSCVMSMSLFSGTKMEMVYLLIVNARLRRAHKFRRAETSGIPCGTAGKKFERAPLKTAVFCVQNAKIALQGAQSPHGLTKSRFLR